jgi:glycine/D-amino acid oxidase-like deaminating enzyme
VLIVGAGIVGAACARAFAREGLSVAVVDTAEPGGGATAASMGHLLVVDAQDAADPAAAAEYALTRRSMQLWQDWLAETPAHREVAEYARTGTLWIATDAEELAIAARKAAWWQAQGFAAELLDAGQLARCEPLLRPGLAGALRVPGDGRVYPPRVVASWLEQAQARLIRGELVALERQGLRLASGERLWAGLVVLAAGLSSQRWLPPACLVAKKGQLAITQRQPLGVQHQLVELAYLKNAHCTDADTVSFNVQARPEGQLLIGSCRQPGRADGALDLALLGRMLAHACAYLPALSQMSLLRCWTGLRPASQDGQPLLGPHPSLPGVWVACGHEGLGITTALASAELLADLSLGRRPLLDAAPYAPARFLR